MKPKIYSENSKVQAAYKEMEKQQIQFLNSCIRGLKAEGCTNTYDACCKIASELGYTITTVEQWYNGTRRISKTAWTKLYHTYRRFDCEKYW